MSKHQICLATATLVATIFLVFVPRIATATTLQFTGLVDLVLEEETGSVIAPFFPVGTAVEGVIDDPAGVGSIGQAPPSPTAISIPFTCCIFAGLDEGLANVGLELNDDVTLDMETADLLNTLLGTSTFMDGQVVDIVDLEGDTDFGPGRFEAGLSFLFGSNFYGPGSSPDVLADAPSAIAGVFFLAEFDANEDALFSAVGELTSLSEVDGPPSTVPIPPSLAFLLSAVCVGGLYRRRSGPMSKRGARQQEA